MLRKIKIGFSIFCAIYFIISSICLLGYYKDEIMEDNSEASVIIMSNIINSICALYFFIITIYLILKEVKISEKLKYLNLVMILLYIFSALSTLHILRNNCSQENCFRYQNPLEFVVIINFVIFFLLFILGLFICLCKNPQKEQYEYEPLSDNE